MLLNFNGNVSVKPVCFYMLMVKGTFCCLAIFLQMKRILTIGLVFPIISVWFLSVIFWGTFARSVGFFSMLPDLIFVLDLVTLTICIINVCGHNLKI